MEVKKSFSHSITRGQVNSQQAISGQSTDNPGGNISIIANGVQGEAKHRIGSIQDDTFATVPPRSYPSSSRFCLLIVENNQSLGAMLEEAVVSWGYGVWVARNGQEGLALLALHAVDAILLDLHMPVMDGRTMLDEVRWAGYTMPVWVMSGGMEARVLERLRHEGAQGFLIKPFGLGALQQALEQMIDQQW